MRILVIAAACAALAGGCQPARTIATSATFSAQEAAFIKKPGAGTILGHAFRTRPSTGTVVNAAGEVIRLVPATAYARERFGQLYGARKFLPVARYPREEALDPAYVEHTRTVKSQANGRFVFEKVPPGTYFVTGQVVWGEDEAREGGSLYDMVTLTGRETGPVEVILSGS